MSLWIYLPWIFHIYGIIQYITFFLASVTLYSVHLCCSMCNCMDLPHFVIHWYVGGHLVCFHPLAIVNTAAVNIHIQTFVLSTCFHFFGVHTQELNVESCGNFYVYLFAELSNYFPQWIHHFIFPPAMYRSSNLSTSLANWKSKNKIINSRRCTTNKAGNWKTVKCRKKIAKTLTKECLNRFWR